VPLAAARVSETLAEISAHELEEHWLNQALSHAGIDRRRWHPAAGVDENRQTIESVYAYYGRLFVAHPYLLWAGMASLVGPSFYAGFIDIGLVPDAARRLVRDVFGRGSRRLSTDAAGDLGFYETTFLIMQKKIFEDQAPMHEAFLTGGLEEIERLYREQIIDLATLTAWRQIEAGRRGGAGSALDSGNRTLLWREQRDIINRFYLAMLDHRAPEGRLLTYAMTVAGAPSVPGALSYPQVYPLVLSARIAGAAIRLTTPLARGNIAEFADRWNLIERNTLPDYLRFVREHPSEAHRLAETPVSVRARRYRILDRSRALVGGALTRWRLGVTLNCRDGVAAGARAEALTPGEPLEVDLTAAPSARALGFAEGAPSRLWTGRGGRPVRVVVRLPEGREFADDAELVAALSLTRDGRPSQLIVQEPPAGFDRTESRLRALAATWNIRLREVTDWKKRAARLSRSPDRTYATHVVTAPEMGFVHLELEISHHVRENEFVISASFSWRPSDQI
jgi:hypothetical protein